MNSASISYLGRSISNPNKTKINREWREDYSDRSISNPNKTKLNRKWREAGWLIVGQSYMRCNYPIYGRPKSQTSTGKGEKEEIARGLYFVMVVRM